MTNKQTQITGDPLSCKYNITKYKLLLTFKFIISKFYTCEENRTKWEIVLSEENRTNNLIQNESK